MFNNGALISANNSASSANYLVKQTIADAQQSFNCIGKPGLWA